MTIPVERTRAVLRTRNFLLDLLDPKATPRVSREVRDQARRCLYHYPFSTDLARSADLLPQIWGRVE